MGATGSVIGPDTARRENTSVTLASVSSGYQSVQDVADIKSTPVPQPGSKMTSVQEKREKKLVQRPSNISISNFEKYEIDQEEMLEKRVIESAPRLEKALEGHKELKAYMEKTEHKKPENLGTLHKLLTDKLAEVYSQYQKDEQRTVIANSAARNNLDKLLVLWYNFVTDYFEIESMMCSFVSELDATENSSASMEPHLKDGFYVLLTIREVLWNFSDSSHTFSVKLSETGLFKTLAKDLKDIYEEEFEDIQEEEYSSKLIFPFSSAVGILHNCARNPDVYKGCFREINVVDNLTPFLKAESTYVKMVTLLALCNMVTEEEVSKLAADNDVISLLTKAIKEAIKSDERIEHGFHLAELIDGLAAMAQSNDNKIIMMKKNAIALVMKILRDSKVSSSEVLACVKLVWELSFSEEIKNEIRENHDLIRELRKLQKSNIKDIEDASSNVLFLLIDKDIIIKDEIPEVAGPAGQPGGKHIMISYSMGDKQQVLKIYSDLKKIGYSIWIATRQSSSLGGMAAAVERASVILLCYSEKYKNSQTCRTEADYMFVKRKKFIPLKMQEKYSPDGWLGILIGAKLYIEFSRKYSYTEKFQELVDAVNREISHQETAEILPAPVPAPKPQTSSVKDWTREKVDKWITDSNLVGSSFQNVRQLSSANLAFLIRVLNESPDTYYCWLESKLALETLEDQMNFDEALRAVAN